MGNPIYSNDYVAGCSDSYFSSDDFRGCDIRISAEDTIHHQTRGSNYKTRPTVRSYRDGLRVGCTFVTTQALDQLYKLHKSFINNNDCKVHQ